jgi:hypothetical protein
VGIDRPDEHDGPRDGPERGSAGTVPGPECDLESDALERANSGPRYRASVEAAYREHHAADETSDEWDAAVPALREAWAEHELKWSATERSAVRSGSGSAEVAGSWQGDGGRRLAPDANAEVGRGCERIREVGENVITPAMRRIEAEDPQRHLVGLEYRLKGEDRLKEKVADQLDARPGLTSAQALYSVPDAVRFTFCYSEERYASGVRADLTLLRSEGFELAKPLKNAWSADQYKGINTQWREPETGQRFEVQFHTWASFEAKQVSHGAYERIRNPQTPEQELDELEDFQRQVCSKIPIPPGATEINDRPQKEHDG